MEKDNEFDSLCDKVQFFICCDKELDEECKKHMSECTECRAFPEQIKNIRTDLKGLSVPGIKDGEISQRVMKEINASKMFTFPKIKVMRHIGTAAAIVLVVALFAINKNGFLNADKVLNDSVSEVPDTHTAQKKETTDNSQFRYSTIQPGGASSDNNRDLTLANDISDEVDASTPAQQPKSKNAFADDKNNARHQDNTQTSDAPENKEHSYDSTTTEEGVLQAQATDDVETTSEEMTPDAVQESSPEKAESESYDLYNGLLFSTSGAFLNVEFDTDPNALESNILTANSHMAAFENVSPLEYSEITKLGITNQDFISWISTVASQYDYTMDSLTKYFNAK